MSYSVSKVFPKDRECNRLVDILLEAEGIRRDKNLDYTCCIFDEDNQVVATGSLFGNTLRCLAVSQNHQGEGLLNQIITHLMEVQYERGNLHLFVYTKISTAKFFRDLGFSEIARIDKQLVFMENQKRGFPDYLRGLEQAKIQGEKVSSLVVNANPFTLGHQYLVETAAKESDILHLFIVSEEASLVPFEIRKKLVKEGTAHLANVYCHDSGPYIISSATFPSYFQKDEESVIKSQALLDVTVFIKISEALGINHRYVGEEPISQVTNLYNQIMEEELPKAGIALTIVPRKEFEGSVISASTVRKAIQEGDMERLVNLVPKTTLNFFLSAEAQPVIEHIRNAENVIHY